MVRDKMPPRKFVGLRTEIEQIAREYRQTADWRIIRDKLSLGDVDLTNNEIYLVVVDKKDKRFRYGMPNGNEFGAIPGEWAPGGKTKYGLNEAALIGSEDVVYDADINKLLNYFGVENTQKLK